MNPPPHLLAKKRPPRSHADARPGAFALTQHLIDTHRAAEIILDITAAQQLDALGLAGESLARRFRSLVLAAALLHDLGKANDQFQDMIHHTAPRPQRVRHEWVTYHLLGRPDWRDWLAPALAEPADYDLLRWAVASHHLKAADRVVADGAPPALTLLLDHPDFKDALTQIGERLGRPKPPDAEKETLRADTLIDAAKVVYTRWRNADRDTRRLLAAVKATLIAADVGASALTARGAALRTIGDWLSVVPSRAEYDTLVRDKLEEKDADRLLTFQQRGGESRSRVTLVRAGCGSGKTLLAYHWAANRSPVRRLYMCYPTTGTATEGFGDYLVDKPDDGPRRRKASARLFHSRAEVDLDSILRVSAEDDDELAKLVALEAWSTPIVVATVDTVLGLIGSQRRPVYGWPALCQAAFSFDEIHSYDNRLFGALLRFLQDVPGVPVLLMTASLPTPRLKAIEAVLAAQNESLCHVSGPPDSEKAPRYHRLHTTDVDQAVRDELRRGGKVLWVCNTVGRATDVYDRFADARPVLYHSRFRYRDRTTQHSKAIESFKAGGPALVIATQVAEMSLDISATLLVTDAAPVPSLIQRLGRLNRRAKAGNETTMPFFVRGLDGDPPQKFLPYATGPLAYGDWPAATAAWLAALGDGPLSQKDLADRWDSSAEPPVHYETCSAWLDARTSEPQPIRDASPGVSVLLEEDRGAAASDRRAFVESIIPMNQPPRGEWKSSPAVRGVAVALKAALSYDEKGAEWVR